MYKRQATVDSVIDTTSKIDMVIFQETHIKKTNAMVHTTTNLHSLLLQHTETWSSLTGEMCIRDRAKDEARHCAGFAGLYKRYFK